jgi:hypothetical protein
MSIGVEQPETVRTLPEECEEVYSGEVDRETDRRLRAIEGKFPTKAPSGDGNSGVWQWILRVGGIGGVVAFVVVMANAGRYVISSEIGKALDPIGQRLAKIETRLDDMEKRQDRIDSKALPVILKEPLPAKPSDVKSALQQRTDVLVSAASHHIELTPRSLPIVLLKLFAL